MSRSKDSFLSCMIIQEQEGLPTSMLTLTLLTFVRFTSKLEFHIGLSGLVLFDQSLPKVRKSSEFVPTDLVRLCIQPSIVTLDTRTILLS